MRRRHDTFLKRLYRAGTRDAVSLFFPEIAARIDWNQWQWIDKEIPIRGRRNRAVVADLVGETRDVDGQYLKLLVHPELQMEPDATMDMRALEYNAGLMLQEGGPETRVLTIVFHHCTGAGAIQKRRAVQHFYDEELHTVTYWSVGLGELEAAQYAEEANPIGWALASWMRQRHEERVDLRLRLMEKIMRFVSGEEYQELLLDAVETYFTLSEAERQVEEQLLQTGKYKEVVEMAETVMERREARARREGEVQAMQAAVKHAIRTRFPAAPESLMEPVERVQDAAALEALLGRVILAANVEEVGRLLAESIGA